MLLKKKKEKVGKVAESDRNVKFLIVGIVLGILLIVYVFIVLGALSEDTAAIFSGFSDSSESALKYDFESFESTFPGELDRISAELDSPEPEIKLSSSTVSTSTTSTVATSTASSSDEVTEVVDGEGDDSLVDDSETGV